VIGGWFQRRSAWPAQDHGRWVVLDVESSGLDAQRDRLLAIAAVALQHDGQQLHIQLGDSFEVVLRHDAAPVDKPNILLHGIGVGAQRDGVAAADALAAFERWVAAAPLIGWHVAFDEVLIQRAMKAALGHRLHNPWIDLAEVAPVLRPQVVGRSLDEWLLALDVRCAVRHQAAADTLATAELLLKLWPDVCAQDGNTDWRALQRLAAQRRWLRPS
jgi:DNA polymerase III subunit epsilon